MGHAKVAQAPGQGGDDAQAAVGGGGALGHVVALGQVQVAGEGLGVGHHRVPAAGLADAEEHDDHQSHGHNHALDQVVVGHGQKAAQNGVDNDNHRAENHGGVVVHPEEAGEQGADGLKAGGGVGDEEDQHHQGGDAGQHVPVVVVPAGEEAGDGDGLHGDGVVPQPLGHDQPVQVGAHGQADGGPAGLGNAGDVGQARQAHQQPAAHVRGLGAHGGDDGAQLPAAQIELVGGPPGVFLAEVDAHEDHQAQIGHNGHQDADFRGGHVAITLLGIKAHVSLSKKRVRC